MVGFSDPVIAKSGTWDSASSQVGTDVANVGASTRTGLEVGGGWSENDERRNEAGKSR